MVKIQFCCFLFICMTTEVNLNFTLEVVDEVITMQRHKSAKTPSLVHFRKDQTAEE